MLERVQEADAAFLERVVVDLLIAMGYGGGNPAMGQATGRPGDGGIDGTIREDALGLDEVYIQAKKYADGQHRGRKRPAQLCWGARCGGHEQGRHPLEGNHCGTFVSVFPAWYAEGQGVTPRPPRRTGLAA